MAIYQWVTFPVFKKQKRRKIKEIRFFLFFFEEQILGLLERNKRGTRGPPAGQQSNRCSNNKTQNFHQLRGGTFKCFVVDNTHKICIYEQRRDPKTRRILLIHKINTIIYRPGLSIVPSLSLDTEPRASNNNSNTMQQMNNYELPFAALCLVCGLIFHLVR